MMTRVAVAAGPATAGPVSLADQILRSDPGSFFGKLGAWASRLGPRQSAHAAVWPSGLTKPLADSSAMSKSLRLVKAVTSAATRLARASSVVPVRNNRTPGTGGVVASPRTAPASTLPQPTSNGGR